MVINRILAALGKEPTSEVPSPSRIVTDNPYNIPGEHCRPGKWGNNLTTEQTPYGEVVVLPCGFVGGSDLYGHVYGFLQRELEPDKIRRGRRFEVLHIPNDPKVRQGIAGALRASRFYHEITFE